MRGARLLAIGIGLVLGGCGGPGPTVVSRTETQTVGDPGHTDRMAQHRQDWPPGVEAVYRQALASRLGENHVVAIEWGAFGPQLYDAYMLFWGSEGPFRAVRAHLPFAELDRPRWIEDELPRDEGERVLERLGEIGITALGDDDTVSQTVHGQGKVLFHTRIGSRVGECVVAAPWALAEANGDTRYRDALLLLLEVVPPQT